jgi:hypothetical protein
MSTFKDVTEPMIESIVSAMLTRDDKDFEWTEVTDLRELFANSVAIRTVIKFHLERLINEMVEPGKLLPDDLRAMGDRIGASLIHGFILGFKINGHIHDNKELNDLFGGKDPSKFRTQ